jgi:hypothetical protein|tara:strand:- start:11 stop:592 length:582 start_codon:yes stop_codon:yes gene_type:complete
MIYIKDNFLPNNLYKELLNYSDKFNEVKTPGKSFWVKKLPNEFIEYITGRLEKLEGNKIKNILAFLREAKEGQDNDWRIHNDSIIEGQQPDRAIVLYIKGNEQKLNGTAFWEHENYGHTYIKSNDKEFDRMLKEDANDKSKWKLNSVVGYKDNRLLSYPGEYFHSKYPNEYKDQRIVLVMFYKTIKNERTKTK